MIMEQKEFKIQGYDFTFRIAKMNAIEVLAIRTQLKTQTIADSTKLFTALLEHIEVKASETQWLPVKVKNQEEYYPIAVESDVNLVDGLISEFMSYLIEVFTK